jgi:hypothetical protein
MEFKTLQVFNVFWLLKFINNTHSMCWLKKYLIQLNWSYSLLKPRTTGIAVCRAKLKAVRERIISCVSLPLWEQGVAVAQCLL